MGHLAHEIFKLIIQNINRNLNSGGLYIFNIFNLDYLKAGNNIIKLTGDWMDATDVQKFNLAQSMMMVL